MNVLVFLCTQSLKIIYQKKYIGIDIYFVNVCMYPKSQKLKKTLLQGMPGALENTNIHIHVNVIDNEQLHIRMTFLTNALHIWVHQFWPFYEKMDQDDPEMVAKLNSKTRL